MVSAMELMMVCVRDRLMAIKMEPKKAEQMVYEKGELMDKLKVT